MRFRPFLFLLSLLNTGCSLLLREGAGGPIGASARAGNYIATMMQTQEGALPSVPPRPEKDRFKLKLVLHSLDSGEKRVIPLADGLRSSEYMHSARFLGDDGVRIWFHAHEPMAYDYHSHRLIRNAVFPGRTGLPARTAGTDFQEPAEQYRSKYKMARFVLKEASGKPLQLSQPNGHLITYGSIVTSVSMARLSDDGQELWKADTGLKHLEQILPDTKITAVIGRPMPKSEVDVPPMTLVLIDMATGKLRAIKF
jgi:hypothetical protein